MPFTWAKSSDFTWLRWNQVWVILDKFFERNFLPNFHSMQSKTLLIFQKQPIDLQKRWIIESLRCSYLNKIVCPKNKIEKFSKLFLALGLARSSFDYVQRTNVFKKNEMDVQSVFSWCYGAWRIQNIGESNYAIQYNEEIPYHLSSPCCVVCVMYWVNVCNVCFLTICLFDRLGRG